MKIRRIISIALAVLMLMSVFTVAASAAEADLSGTGYSNQSYLENYAAQAAKEKNLGATYTPSATTFKVWAPTASNVQLKRYKTGSDSESGAGVIETKAMTKQGKMKICNVNETIMEIFDVTGFSEILTIE